MLKAKEIEQATSGIIRKGREDVLFKDICIDSRKSKKGDLFWAIKGQRFDGHDFVISALDKGAFGAVIEHCYAEELIKKTAGRDVVLISVKDSVKALGDLARHWRDKHTAKVIVVTGSSGKTTTKELLFSILSQRHNVLKNPGNYNNLIGLPVSLLKLSELHSVAVLEMGMNRAGEIERLTQIANPDIGIITNIGPVHLEGVKDIKGVAKAKAELAKMLPQDSVLFVNGDCDLLVEEVEKYSKKTIRFGRKVENDIVLKHAFVNDRLGIDFCMSWGNKSFDFSIPLAGIHNAMNAMIAAAVSLYMGMSLEEIKKGFLSYKGIKGRFQIIELVNGNTLIDDTYNANPASLKAAVETISYIKAGKKLFIGLGDMLELGDYSIYAHQEAGKMVAMLDPDLFIVTGRFSEEMAKAAKQAGMPEDRIIVSSSLQQMASEIEERLKDSRDVIVFLKASRAVSLDKVAESILNKFRK